MSIGKIHALARKLVEVWSRDFTFWVIVLYITKAKVISKYIDDVWFLTFELSLS